MSRSVPSHRWRTLAVVLVAALVGCDGDDGMGPTVATQLAFTVQPGDATAGASIAPAGVAASERATGAVITAAVEIQDGSGNVVTTATNAVTIAIGTNPAGGTLSGMATVNAVNGVANFTDLTIERAVSGYTLSASATGLTSATSAAFNITPAAAAGLVFTVEPSDGEVYLLIAPAVEVAIQDAFGNAVTTATDAVTLEIGTNTGGGTLAGATTVDALGGMASFTDLIIDKTGTGYTLVATSAGLTQATSASFDIIFPLSSLDAGFGYNCGLTTGMNAYCWGSNSAGQLGDGTATDRSTPRLVSGDLSFTWLNLGRVHTCGISSGDAYCWGQNGFGQLGDGTTSDQQTPTMVSGGLSFASLSAGASYTCGITTGGDTYCWGINFLGQLGDSTRTDRSTPVQVVGGLSFVKLTAAGAHTCAITSAGDAYCWGAGGSGQLGDGTIQTFRLAPGPVSSGLSFTSLSAAGNYTCGLTDSDAAYCWGENVFGQLGNGANTDTNFPGLVSGGFSFATIDASDDHTCGVTTAGDTYCWGHNDFGQLGDGTQNDSNVPVTVSGGVSFTLVRTGNDQTCALTAAGEGYCWGQNVFGQLGDGTTTNSLTPVRVSDP